MSEQILLQGKILGIEEFLLSPPGGAAPARSNGEELLAGRSQWITLLCEVLPRALLAEFGLARILLGSSGGGQFLLVLPGEARGAAQEFLSGAARQLGELSGSYLTLLWSVTENLGDWSVVRKRLNEELQHKRATANPIRNDEGEISKWFGTCTDIEDQKHTQQVLEEQILERTAQLADVNTRLQEEMLEKDFARNELDLQNERMMGELKKRSERATMLAKMGELLQSCINRDEVFAAALGFAPKIFPAARGAVVLLNPGRSLAEV